MAGSPLILTPEIIDQMHELRDIAANRPVDMQALKAVMEMTKRLKQFKGMDPNTVMENMAFRAAMFENPIMVEHRKQMEQQTLVISGPWPYYVAYSMENQPIGLCRHLSMSVKRDGRVPNEFSLWMVAEEFGFSGSLRECTGYVESLLDGGKAVNIVQPVQLPAPKATQ